MMFRSAESKPATCQRRVVFLLRVLLSVACLFGGRPAVAVEHPISITETQIFVSRTAARVRIKLFAEDLFLFQGLEPQFTVDC